MRDFLDKQQFIKREIEIQLGFQSLIKNGNDIKRATNCT